MPCDRKLKQNQTIQQRVTEIRKVTENLVKAIAMGRVKAKVGPQGAIAFIGLSDEERDGVTDACAYRRLLTSGSPSALQAIARAEALAGRSVNRQTVAVGAHSHDNGVSWHSHKG